MLPYSWRLCVAVARVALGIACLAQFIATGPVFWWGALPLLAFVVYSVFAFQRATATAGNPLLTSMVDTAAFFVWYVLTARSGSTDMFWFALAMAAYLFVIGSAVVLHTWTRVAAAVAICLTAMFAVPAALPIMMTAMIGPAALAVVWVLHRSYLESRLARASKHSVMYRFEAQQAREEERQRIAADFHDGPLQSFIGLQMRLEIIKKMLARDPKLAADELLQLQDLCKSQVGELRAFVRSMRPAYVEGSTLGASISRMVEQFQKDTGISTSFLSGDYLDPAETETSLELLQIVREALNNVQKHARATRVAVALNKQGDCLEISVDDNGAGFPFTGTYSLDQLDGLHLGPVSIRRRVRAIGGELKVESRPGQGTGLKVRVAAS